MLFGQANMTRLFRAVTSITKYVLAAVKRNDGPERLQLAQALLIKILASTVDPGLINGPQNDWEY